jgi:hypothetical protein
MMSDSDSPDSTPLQNATHTISKLQRQYQQQLDRWTPHVLNRWLATAGLLALFVLRILIAQGVRFLFFTGSWSLLMLMALFVGSGISVRASER